VLAGMGRIAHIPATLIHGRYDVSGPLDTAWELHKAWPASHLVVVEDAGHFGGSMGEQFTAAIDAMADELRPDKSMCPRCEGNPDAAFVHGGGDGSWEDL
jgi:proline iminopeptidase